MFVFLGAERVSWTQQTATCIPQVLQLVSLFFEWNGFPSRCWFVKCYSLWIFFGLEAPLAPFIFSIPYFLTWLLKFHYSLDDLYRYNSYFKTGSGVLFHEVNLGCEFFVVGIEWDPGEKLWHWIQMMDMPTKTWKFEISEVIPNNGTPLWEAGPILFPNTTPIFEALKIWVHGMGIVKLTLTGDSSRDLFGMVSLRDHLERLYKWPPTKGYQQVTNWITWSFSLHENCARWDWDVLSWICRVFSWIFRKWLFIQNPPWN